jgi:hypothetical protein
MRHCCAETINNFSTITGGTSFQSRTERREGGYIRLIADIRVST